MPNDYFSDRELGPRPRVQQEITEATWGGIVALIKRFLSDGSFGQRFPEECPDGDGICGTNQHDFSLALKAEISEIQWPLNSSIIPSTLDTLDLLEFCHRVVAKPSQISFHSFHRHHHLVFETAPGQADFRNDVNRILSRNQLTYELNSSGEVKRIAPPILQEALNSAVFSTGDNQLDELLETARTKFLDPNPTTRKDSLEKLWDAWERLKTVEPGKDKKASVTTLLNRVTQEINFRKTLEKEAKELTDIGNTFRIRHSETTQIPLNSDEQVDYLFHRLFALIWLALKAPG